MAIELEDTAQAVERTATVPGKRPAPAPTGQLAEGQRLGHFQIIKPLGAGGMGEVYLATDLALDRQVALKVLPGGAGSAAARDRLIREARAQARVQHTNVAHIYFIGEDTGLLYFAMELVSGRTLAQLVEDKPLSADDALALIHDAALGLREAQRSGFTHRDVKPSNLMVDGHGVVKVLDFGIAAGGDVADGAGGSVAQTSLAGTPLYMAPEQARGEPVDFRADIYALGATLFQLVTGKPPFTADTLEELRTLHASAPRPALPRTIARTKSAALLSLIGRMMAPNADDRFASYDELLMAIESVSTHYTRPAGVVARLIASGAELIVLSLVVGFVSVPFSGNGNVSLAFVLPVLAAVQLVSVARFGLTLGGAAFDLEVVDVRTGRRPTWRAAAVRILVLYMPAIAFDLAAKVARTAGAARLTFVLEFGVPFTALVMFMSLVYASLRTPGKRAVWDRASGTMVRYRVARRSR